MDPAIAAQFGRVAIIGLAGVGLATLVILAMYGLARIFE